MTISAEIPELIATAAPGQTVFAFDFRLFETRDLDVFVDGVGAVYTPVPVTALEYKLTILIPPFEGGSITFGVPMIGGEQVALYRAVPIERATNFPPSGPVPMDDINLEFDRHIAIMQDLEADTDRLNESTLRVPPPETIGPLPPADERAQGILGFDGSGNPIIFPPANFSDFAVTAYREEVIAVAGQTVFATAVQYLPGHLGVYVNGVRLSLQEFTATDGLHVTLLEPLKANDVVLMEGFLGSTVATVGPPGPPGPAGAQVMFIGDNPPSAPVNGRTWWESDTGNMFVYFDDGTSAQWVPAHIGAAPAVIGGSITIGTVAPASPVLNQVWIDTN